MMEQIESQRDIVIDDLRGLIRGEVLAVGNGKVNDNGEQRALDVKAGDKVLFGKYAGTEVKVDGEEMIIMDESDILAVLE